MDQDSRSQVGDNRNAKSLSNRVRLNKFLAEEGVSSRRACDRLIEEGRITVNGKKVFELGSKIDPKTDKILVDGKPLRRNVHGKIVAIMHKPRGVLTTMEDPIGRPTIADYLEKLPVRLFPVGRLDWDSEGLLLLTNDGDFAQKVAHPTSEVTKTYIVKLDGSPKNEELQRLKQGVSIPGGRVKALAVSRFPKGDSKQYSWVKIVITEGKNRQIRYMFEKIGYDVIKLQRVAIGRLRLGALERGKIAFLNEVAAERVFHKFLDENGQAPSEQDERPFAGGAPEREGRAARPGMREASARAASVREAHARARGDIPEARATRKGGGKASKIGARGAGAINKDAPRRKYEGGKKIAKDRSSAPASDKRKPRVRTKSSKRDLPTKSFDFDSFE